MGTIMGTITGMAMPSPTDPVALLTLVSWLSPSCPVGAYSYSHGIEWLVESGDIGDGDSLYQFLADCLAAGAGWSDAILFAAAWRAPASDEISSLAAALCPSSERRLETMAQGAAFARVVSDAWGIELGPAAYPVAVARAARIVGAGLEESLSLYLHAWAQNLVSAAVRLVPLGQTDGQRVIARLAPLVAGIADRAIAADPDDLGGVAFGADIASMRHETQHTRLFRS